MTNPLVIHGVSCAHNGCAWTGEAVWQYERHALKNHGGRL